MSFVHFAAAHGLILDHPLADGRWHRTRTTDKPRKRNGAYLWTGDRGVVKNWATMEDFAVYKDENSAPSHADMARRLQQARDARERDIAKRNRAADEAEAIVQRCEFVVPAAAIPSKAWRMGKAAVHAHPYLVRKGLPRASALVLDGVLIVPMWVGKRLVNVQRIAEDGTKRFLPGGTAKAAYHRIGNPNAREQWLVEGYATGLSVKAALERLHADAAVVVCFSAGNLKECGGTHVFADGDEAGRKAAEGTGLPWVTAPDGMDANDLMTINGLTALVEVIQTIR